MFQAPVHRIDFDEPSREAFQVARYPEGSSFLRRTAMHCRSIVLFIVAALLILGGSFTTAQDKAAKDPEREPDKLEFGDRKEPVFEAGIANLTKSETTMLVHFGKERMQQ
jgi:hypothetical protein